MVFSKVVKLNDTIYDKYKINELENSLSSLHHMGMFLLRSNSQLGRIIDLLEDYQDTQDPLVIAASVQRALAHSNISYVFKIALPQHSYVFSSDSFVSFAQERIISHLSQQTIRMIHHEHYWAVIYPHFTLCVTLTEEQRDQYIDNLSRLASVVSMLMEKLGTETLASLQRENQSQQNVERTLDLLDDIMAIENTRSDYTVQIVADLKWTIQNAILSMGLNGDKERQIMGVIGRLLNEFEEQQASYRLIESYVRTAKRSLTELTHREEKTFSDQPTPLTSAN
ncbi:hypothetical protein EUZ85_28745 [Hahella sp. KA22]|uniref:hypothetical protein n=1 Tax=Hahella sp. KA22 TaxID=1628392 RepID=UPI000FDDF299|nr:hypothetical protein [Hahella sp. KA22]AZZ94486.1 hypothetical protein ENC22_26160 [Hahella sp. KA22]QAY57859.1 hypothetical protein EUZ85_28745 [Hahella sp. KA22]